MTHQLIYRERFSLVFKGYYSRDVVRFREGFAQVLVCHGRGESLVLLRQTNRNQYAI